MNKIFTQIALGVVCLFANVANAQVTENFNGGLDPLKNKCWQFNNMTTAAASTSNNNGNNATSPIEGAYSIRQELAGSLGELSTPFYVISTPLNVSFKYKISNKLQNSATRVIEIGTFDQNNNFVAHGSSITLSSSNTQNNSGAVNFNGTINTNGTFRVGVRINSNSGDGNSILLIDELSITPADATKMTLKYASSCNTKPVATNNIYVFNLGQPVAGNVITDGTQDSDFDGESLIAVNFLQTEITSGKINLTANGSFTFEGNPIDGDRITFTYQVRDNGYNAELSEVATVTISFIQASILPVHFTSFSGNLSNNKASLTWNVADNETGSYFEIERSADGKSFKAISTMFTSNQTGNATYTFADAGFVNSGSYYRIKVVNKDNTTSYSRIISLKGTTSADNQIVLMQNPVQSSLNFTFTSVADEANEVTIYNLAGIKMHSQKVQAHKGSNSVSLSLDGKLIRGNYILTVQSVSANRSIQFVKQ